MVSLQLKDLNGQGRYETQFKQTVKRAREDDSKAQFKHMYQNCDIQADSIDNTHLIAEKTNAAIFN